MRKESGKYSARTREGQRLANSRISENRHQTEEVQVTSRKIQEEVNEQEYPYVKIGDEHWFQ